MAAARNHGNEIAAAAAGEFRSHLIERQFAGSKELADVGKQLSAAMQRIDKGAPEARELPSTHAHEKQQDGRGA